MAKPRRSPEQIVIAELREKLEQLRSLIPSVARNKVKKTIEDLHFLGTELELTRGELDPIKDPGTSFDPADPDTAGRLVALALIAQEKIPLAQIARTYGSGVYAIYYHGDHPAYAPLKGTETPIYVGKADPERPDARTSREQGPQLFGRLSDHRRMIRTVSEYAIENGLPHPLSVDDFSCRRLVCATNAQLVAERHLISAFKPIWNNEMGICWGISKHGDAAETRKNKRSPWDVLHPGRRWAMDAILEDKNSPERIIEEIGDHFALNPPHTNRDSIVSGFIAAFVQNSAVELAAAVCVDEETVVDEGPVTLTLI